MAITGTAVLTLAAAKIAADIGALGKITTSYTITPSGTIGADAAAGISATIAAKLSTGLAISDTAANLISSLSGLQTLKTAGKLASVTVTGTSNTVTAAQAKSLAALTNPSYSPHSRDSQTGMV